MASLSEYYEIVTPVFMLNPNIRAKKLQSNSVIGEMENGRGERIPTTKWRSVHMNIHMVGTSSQDMNHQPSGSLSWNADAILHFLAAAPRLRVLDRDEDPP
jgi:hypothetical protein